jgi:hypothetical protein
VSCVHPFSVFDNFRGVPFHHGNARVGSSEIDTDCLRHEGSPLDDLFPRVFEHVLRCRQKARLSARTGTTSRRRRLITRLSLTSIFFASVCAGFGVDPDSAAVIAAALRERLPRQPDGQTAISVPLSEGTPQLAPLPSASEKVRFLWRPLAGPAFRRRRSSFSSEPAQIM